MYNVSQDYLDNIWKNGRKIEWYGTIALADGETVYHFDPSNMLTESFSITNQVCANDALELGSTGSAELKLALILTEVSGTYYLDGQVVDRYAFYNAVVEINFRLYYTINNVETYEDVPMGVFNVSEPIRTNKKLMLTCYDNMLLFGKEIQNMPGQDTPYNLFAYACEVCEVEMGSEEEDIEALVHGDLSTYADATVSITTWRDYIGYLAQSLLAIPVIGRDGKLYVKPYSMTSTRQIPQTARYTLELADYEAYYTSVSLYDVTAKATLVKADTPDDGLRYKFGSNPFIQGGAQSYLETKLQDLLDELDDLRYTPLKATIIGDPSLDCLDVLQFQNNGVVSSKLSGITKIVYGFSGVQVECNGENPKTIDVQSKIGTEVEGLSRNPGSGSELFYYDYTNASAIQIADGATPKDVIVLRYAPTVDTHLDFHAEIKHTLDDVATVKAQYLIDNALYDYEPEQIEMAGKNLLHLLLPFRVLANTLGRFVVRLGVDGGDLSIASGDIKAYIAGYGIGGGEIPWDGNIDIEEEWERNVEIPAITFDETSVSDNATIGLIVPTPISISETYQNISIPSIVFDENGVTDAVTVAFVILSAIIDTNSTVVRDATYTTITSGQFVLQTEYTESSVTEVIDSGYCTKVTPFVTGLTVSDVEIV